MHEQGQKQFYRTKEEVSVIENVEKLYAEDGYMCLKTCKTKYRRSSLVRAFGFTRRWSITLLAIHDVLKVLGMTAIIRSNPNAELRDFPSKRAKPILVNCSLSFFYSLYKMLFEQLGL